MAAPKTAVITTSLLFALLLLPTCDRHSTPSEDFINTIRCDTLTLCPGASTEYGMVGDSWADFAGGIQLTRDLHDVLVLQYGLRITSSVIAGQTIELEANTFRGFERVITLAGPRLRYMLLSLGGNDMLRTTSEYVPSSAATMNARLNRVEQNLRGMISYGNMLKRNLYGGEPPIWIIHAYDYVNPDVSASCVQGAINAGMSSAQAFQLAVDMVDSLNGRYQMMANSMPELRYVDLRGTLGGPPRSNPGYKVDCIHPNQAGFELVGIKFGAALQSIAQGSPQR